MREKKKGGGEASDNLILIVEGRGRGRAGLPGVFLKFHFHHFSSSFLSVQYCSYFCVPLGEGRDGGRKDCEGGREGGRELRDRLSNVEL